MQPKPFLRWAGGKRQLLPAINEAFGSLELGPKARYFEPFIGGGAVFFSIATSAFGKGMPAGFVINDANQELTNLYLVVRDEVDELVQQLELLTLDTSAEAFYKIRSATYVDPVSRAARFVFLNRLCFNGLYRVNSTGGFNVPYGRLKNPVVCNEPLLRSCSAWLKEVDIRNGDFVDALKGVKKGDVVYLDPPYVALTKTASFSSYHASGFGIEDHERLSNLIEKLDQLGVHVLLSNSDTETTRELFSKLNLYSVRANRSISASGSSRNAVSELIGVNFKVSRQSELLKKI